MTSSVKRHGQFTAKSSRGVPWENDFPKIGQSFGFQTPVKRRHRNKKNRRTEKDSKEEMNSKFMGRGF